MQQIGIRRALVSDSNRLDEVRHNATCLAQQDQANRWPDVVPMRKWLETEGIFTYLAEDEENIFGFVTVGPSQEDVFDDGQTGELLEWYMLPDACGQGYGRKLLVHGLSVLKRRLSERAIIWIPSAAERALQVLHKCGFADTGVERVRNMAGAVPENAYDKTLADFF